MFPPEIIDHVLSFLQWDCATLKVCAKAHSTFSKLVERHLYAHLTVQNSYRNSDIYYPADLLELILDDPNIAKHVRSLHLNLWLFQDSYDELEWILPALTRLEAIFLASGENLSVSWDELDKSFRNAFTNCLRLPTLTDVKIASITDFPLTALDHSSSHKRLLLLGDFHHLPLVSSPTIHPSLDSLLLYECCSVEMVTSWAQSRRIRSLDFSGDLEPFSQLLKASANTLTTLKVHIPPDRSTRFCHNNNDAHFTPIPFSLASLPHLTQLTIKSFTQLFWDKSQDSKLQLSHNCLPGIMHLLNTLPSPPTKVAQLVISIDINLDHSMDVSEINWSPLITFPYFDVIPHIELRVCALKMGKEIPPVELLKTLKKNPHLMQLEEEHHSFLMNAVEEESLDGYQLKDAYI